MQIETNLNASILIDLIFRIDLVSQEEGGLVVGGLVDEAISRVLQEIETREYNRLIRPYVAQRLKDCLVSVVEV